MLPEDLFFAAALLTDGVIPASVFHSDRCPNTEQRAGHPEKGNHRRPRRGKTGETQDLISYNANVWRASATELPFRQHIRSLSWTAAMGSHR